MTTKLYLEKNCFAFIRVGWFEGVRSPTQPCKEGQLPQGSYISQSSWPFSPSFFTLFPCIDIHFYYFYRFNRHTRTYCKNPRVKISNIEVFTGLWKWPKLDQVITIEAANIWGKLFLSWRLFILDLGQPRKDLWLAETSFLRPRKKVFKLYNKFNSIIYY